jgi:hopanoid biosynthesis associated protein HpnK
MRRLIVTADDFGNSPSINAAVLKAHREGILTCASLMVSGGAAAEAIEIARENPTLGVGLHLTLICGKALSPGENIPGLVDGRGCFSEAPVRTGFRYFARHSLRQELRKEIDAQISGFRATGLKMDHLNGHLNLHLHPTVLALLMEHARSWGLTHMRLTRDPLLLNLRLARGNLLYRAFHALVFSLLSLRSKQKLESVGIRFTHRVFGLLQNGRVDEVFVSRLLKALPDGDSELYCHPSLRDFRQEYEAMVAPRIRQTIRNEGVELIRYQDL